MNRRNMKPFALSWITRRGARRVVAMARVVRGLVSVLWVVDARSGVALDLGQSVVAERLSLYEAIRDAEKASA